MQASNLAQGQAGHAFFALTHSMNKHGRAAAMVTPIGDKKTLLPAESAASRSGCAGRGRVQEGSSRRTNGSTQGCRERSDAMGTSIVAQSARFYLQRSQHASDRLSTELWSLACRSHFRDPKEGWVRAQQRPERGVGAAPAAETPRPPGVVSAPAEEIGRGGGV